MATKWYVAPNGAGASVYEVDEETGADRLVADVYSGEKEAAMIAALPDLLAALERIVAINGSTGGHKAMVAEFKHIARMAIDKVR